MDGKKKIIHVEKWQLQESLKVSETQRNNTKRQFLHFHIGQKIVNSNKLL
jgi:hypothetical protein